MNFIGGSLSFMVPTLYVDAGLNADIARTQITSLLLAQFKISLLALAVTTLLYRDVPIRKNSDTFTDRKAVSIFKELGRVLRLRDFWLVNCQFGLYLTVMNTFDAIEG